MKFQIVARRLAAILIASTISLSAVILLLISARLPSSSLNAADDAQAGGIAEAGTFETYYLVMKSVQEGEIELLTAHIVNLSSELPVLSTMEMDQFLLPERRDSEPVSVLLLDDDGNTVYRSLAQIPKWLRGEYHSRTDEEFSEIDGHLFPLENSVFVIRVPVIDDTRLQLRGAQDEIRATIDLDAIHEDDFAFFSRSAAGLVHNALNGSPDNRVDMLIIAEGYTVSERDDFEQTAEQFADDFFNIEPYADYRNYFNLHTLFVPSLESGADHPPYDRTCSAPTCCSDPAMITDQYRGQFVDTAFDATFCSYQKYRLVTVNTAKVHAAASTVPDRDSIFVLVNDPVYGGSGGPVMVATRAESFTEMVQHEYGHSFSGLADEYSDPFPGYPNCSDIFGPQCEPNVTDVINRSSIKWAPWISAETPIPTVTQFSFDFAEVVGLFEGARYKSSGMYRSGQNCIMRELGQPFCAVPAQTFVLKLYEGGWGLPKDGISLIEPQTVSPTEKSVVLWHPQMMTFSGELLMPVIDPRLESTWYLNGKETGATGDSYVFITDIDQAGEALHLQLVARDETELVHPEMGGQFSDSKHSWLITIGLAPQSASITGPVTGVVSQPYVFTTTTNLTATLPLTYSWHVTDFDPHIVTDTMRNSMSYEWGNPGNKSITVTVENGGGVVSVNRQIEIRLPRLFLPLVRANG